MTNSGTRLVAFKAAAEPRERPVVEIQAPPAEGSRIHPFPARKSNFHAARRYTSGAADALHASAIPSIKETQSVSGMVGKISTEAAPGTRRQMFASILMLESPIAWVFS